MSKKKKKFKSELNRIAQNITRAENSPQIQTETVSVVNNQNNWSANQSNVIFVKKEIGKIIISLIICMVVLVTIWLLDIKTPYVSNASNWVAQKLNIS
jgi:hypothetical protein